MTGEERRFGRPDGMSSSHVACTVEMVSLSNPCKGEPNSIHFRDRNSRILSNIIVLDQVAIIDEIQLLRDPLRGWALTRAFLGTIADEVHICGESGSLELLQRLCTSTNEPLEVHYYDRLTELTIEQRALDSLDKVQPGDCIVCFNINDIFKVSRELESKGVEVAIIYGALPPSTKLKQAAKFNDPNDSCKIMVATDAIGMGLNL